jgi:hypothetical protein
LRSGWKWARTIEEYFAQRVSIDLLTGCWNWKSVLDKNGYGKCKSSIVARKLNECSAHRGAYRHYIGEIPNGMHVCHKCDNPSCVNPEHLFLGTHDDNMEDRQRKNRTAKVQGEAHGKAKLTEKQIKEIRQLQGQISAEKVARQYGIAESTVYPIWTRKSWSHIK